ncbi:hypothetical protein J2S00_003331 [Caldalkalibacillus uzonensis]|uniref:Uncharacterized protein n=1 Tax=Caldalkalibacillus uzonensis TaxID=353224 RepID=A0ABU0CX39_9BACI|nr:hypothetical protein [Caldalkalibacillus uzonensis]
MQQTLSPQAEKVLFEVAGEDKIENDISLENCARIGRNH